jgi:type I restriction enzyme S subunit
MNETLEAMAQALFKSWFVDFDPVIDNALASGKEIPPEFSERAAVRAALGDKRQPLPAEIRTLFPDEFTDSAELGWIPKGWEVSTVGKEFDVTMGQSPPGSTYNENGAGIAFFQGRADFGYRYPSNRVYCTAPKRFANKGDTLVCVRAPVGDVNIAHGDCCIGRGLSAVRHKTGSRSYTYYSMRELREHFNKFEAEGTVFGSINQNDFKSLPNLKIDIKLLESFEVQAGGLDTKIEQNSLAILNLTSLRDTLLPKLLSGEIRIPDAKKMVEELAL